MKRIKLILAIAVLIAAACSSKKIDQGSSNSFNFDTTALKTGDVYYQCPMHPQVISSKEGDCPECGMALEKMTKL